MKILRLFILAVSALLLSCAAYASQSVLKGIYLGGGLGYGQTALSRPAAATMFERDGFAWTAFAGYQFTPHVAAEAGYVNMQDVKAAAGTAARDTVEPWFSYVAVKGILPIQNNLGVFAKLGGAYAYGKETLQIGSMTTIRSQHKIVGYAALGTSYAVNANLSLNLDVSSTFKRGTVPRMTVGTVGVSYLC